MRVGDGFDGVADEEDWRRVLRRRAEVVAGSDIERMRLFTEVGDKVARCIASRGQWVGEVEDTVPEEIKPLHMSAVREALGALIPERLHRSLDAATKKGKDEFGAAPPLPLS